MRSLTIHLNMSFVYTQLNHQTLLFLTIQFSISHLFALSLNMKQFYLTHREGPIRNCISGPEWTWEQWHWKANLHSPKFQHYRSLTIRLFNIIPRTLIERRVLPQHLQRCSGCILQSQPNGCPRGVMVKAMNCGIVVREFVLQSRYYVHFRANTLGKGMNPLILPPAMGK